MEMKELDYFIAIAEEKSISKAAERLFMAQSSLSQFLSILENNVGSKLFIRTSRGVRLTQEGELMLQYAYKTLAEYRSVQNEIKDMKQLKSGRVIMGVSSFRGSYLLPPVLNAFRLEHPDVKVEIVEQNSMVLEQQLLSGEIDIALLVMSEADPRLNIEWVLKDEICLITSHTYPVMEFARNNEDNPDSRIPQYVNLKDTLSYEYFPAIMIRSWAGKQGRYLIRMEYNRLPAITSCQPLCQQLWEQQDWDLHLPITVPDIISEMQSFYLWVQKVLLLIWE